MSSRFLVAALTIVCHAAVARAAPTALGHIDFPVTGSEAAHRHFLRGMLAMHSFWYEEARDEFHSATAAEPGFAMGYWGEALSYYHPIWGEEELAKSRALLDKIPATAPLTDRERGFVAAARVLCGTEPREKRWAAYSAAMGELHRRFPKDDEAATLYAVALLGSAPRDGRFRPFAEAAAIALAVLAHNPDHPGAVHYVIHAFDDPEHAILALPAARRYAQIAPEAYHARHMPSHIFVQLGMWDEAKASNESSWAASVAAAAKKHLDPSRYDLHSLSWLMWISLELGQRERAREELGRGIDALSRSTDNERLPLTVGFLGAQYVLATESWDELDKLLAPLARVKEIPDAQAKKPPTPGCACGAISSAARDGLEARALSAFMRGEAAAARVDLVHLDESAKALAAVTPRMEKDAKEQWKIETLELTARAAELRRQPQAAIDALRAAIAVDEKGPPSGPAGAITARERLAELYARLGRSADALVEFRLSLDRHPRRSRSLLGAARAAVAVKDPLQGQYYAELRANWAHADADTPGLAEVRGASPR